MRRTHWTAITAILAVTMAVAIVYLLSRGDQDGDDPSDATPPGATCHRRTAGVTLTPTDATIYNMVGWLCSKPNSKRRTTIQVLTSGLTYDHHYWDITTTKKKYSYVYAAVEAGWSTFNVDRLGVGESDKPPAQLLTVPNQAQAIEQVIQQLRNGRIDGTAYTRVVSVGHSLGGGIAQYAAATAPEPSMVPDFLVVADFLSATNPGGLTRFAETLVPAATDPAFASARLPDGYQTTRGGTRAQTLFHLPDAEPGIVETDETLKQTGTVAERTTLGVARSRDTTMAVPVPTMITVGQFDSFYCDATPRLSCADSAAIRIRESGNYPPRACLRVSTIPGAGHASNLHHNARMFFDGVTAWLDSYLYDLARQRDANGCLP